MQANKKLLNLAIVKRSLALFLVMLACLLIGLSLSGTKAVSAADKTDKTNQDQSKTESAKESAPPSAISSYQSDMPLSRGILVRLDSNNFNKVLPVSQSDMIDTFGVVISPSEAAISLGSSKSSGKLTYVATRGSYNVVVSDQAGQIKKGEYLTISARDGVAMKATGDIEQSTVIGKAQTNFDGKTNVTAQVTLNDDQGGSKTVNLGLVPVDISVAHNPLITNTKADLPQWLINTGLVDKDVQPIKIYISIGILALAIIIAITVLYAGIRHSVVSIGRNPLSRGSIARSLLSIFLSAFIILIIGSFTVYLILKL